MPENVGTYKICKSSGLLATSRCWSTYQEVLDETHLPEYCNKHTYYRSSTNVTKTSTPIQQNTPSVIVTNERTGEIRTVQVPNN